MPKKPKTALQKFAEILEVQELSEIKNEFNTYTKAIIEIHRLRKLITTPNAGYLKAIRSLDQKMKAQKGRQSPWSVIIDDLIKSFPKEKAEQIFWRIECLQKQGFPIKNKGGWLYWGKDKIKISGFKDRISRLKKNSRSRLARTAKRD